MIKMVEEKRCNDNCFHCKCAKFKISGHDLYSIAIWIRTAYKTIYIYGWKLFAQHATSTALPVHSNGPRDLCAIFTRASMELEASQGLCGSSSSQLLAIVSGMVYGTRTYLSPSLWMQFDGLDQFDDRALWPHNQFIYDYFNCPLMAEFKCWRRGWWCR